MKRTKKLLLLFYFFCLFLTGCTAATQENMDSAENNYTELTLFFRCLFLESSSLEF